MTVWQKIFNGCAQMMVLQERGKVTIGLLVHGAGIHYLCPVHGLLRCYTRTIWNHTNLGISYQLYLLEWSIFFKIDLHLHLSFFAKNNHYSVLDLQLSGLDIFFFKKDTCCFSAQESEKNVICSEHNPGTLHENVSFPCSCWRQSLLICIAFLPEKKHHFGC